MLVSLHVKNMALIDEAEIELKPGLNILTGETGAGKSIIIGSVNTALGFGNFKDYIPENTETALVELIFTDISPEAKRRMEEMDIPDQDGAVIISRIYRSGRTISRINSETVSIAKVKELSALLIDIHGQHQHQSLFHSSNHRLLLDRYAQSALGDLPAKYLEAFRQWRRAGADLEQAQMDEASRMKQMDLLRYEIHEIEEAALYPGEDEEKEALFTRMSGGARIIEALSEVINVFEREEGAAELLGRAARAISSVTSYDSALEDLYSSISSAEDLCTDIHRTASDYVQDFAYDEQQFYEVGGRLDEINRLKQKYGKRIEDILAYLEDSREKLARLEDYENYTKNLSRKVEESYKQVMKLAGAISRIRSEHAGPLGKALQDALLDLNFEGARFCVDLKKLDEPSESGLDEVIFMISANPGMPMRPVWEVASGGELSRIMLAIKSVMAGQDHIGTLIFDEIDTGISGRTASKVAEKMALIAGEHQVICITHLAQIAAMADSHYEISKSTQNGVTHTSIRELDERESTEELARILGGATITENVRTGADEMKKLAKEIKGIRKGAGL